MCRSKGIVILIILILCTSTIPLIKCVPQETTTVKPGRYVPELYGAHLGKYIPDDSGKYYHIHRPYDGGYGDRGIKYVHDASGNLVPLSTRPLGPKDHLRFMIDFNYDNSGWEIINFEWLRDGDDNYKYKYVNENQLFTADAAEESSDTSSNSEQNNNENGGHIDGEYNDNNGYNYSFNNGGANKSTKNLQQAIREVIYYIENNILPTL
ncbi:uncharacterized protein DDB_G0280315 [Calliphora vicina]|uniref:uncharacterized protein DDB_G0280315 n=1 Tax=Calliphora vicina TaxID=7373 RepID=UPI00325B71E0